LGDRTDTKFRGYWYFLMTNSWSRQLASLKVDPNESGLISAWDMRAAAGTIPDEVGVNDGSVLGSIHGQYSALGFGSHFNGASELYIGNDSSLEIPNGSISFSCWCRFDDLSVIRSIISKGTTATNQNYFMRINLGEVQFYFRDSGNTSNVTYSTSDTPIKVDRWYHIAVAHTFGSGSLTKIWVNGVERAGTWSNGTGDELPLVVASFGFIGSRNGNLYHKGDIVFLKFFNNHQSQAWIDNEYARARSALWQIENGLNISTTAITGGPLENSPLRVESGSHQISSYTIGTVSAKVLECVTAGDVSLMAGHYHNDPIASAFGEYDCWLEKAAGHTTKLGFICQGRNTTANGYGMQILTDGTTTIEEFGVGSVVTGGSLTPGTLTHLQMKRRAFDDRFEGLIGGASFGTGIDSTITQSYYTVFSLGAGDKLVITDDQGGYSYVKRLTA
jgi:hypothetical protein